MSLPALLPHAAPWRVINRALAPTMLLPQKQNLYQEEQWHFLKPLQGIMMGVRVENHLCKPTAQACPTPAREGKFHQRAFSLIHKAVCGPLQG